MRSTLRLILTAMFLGATTVALAAQVSVLRADLIADWTAQKERMVAIADAMPEEKFAYKSTPAQRSYGEQILHVAGVNVNLMKVLGAKAPAPTIDMKATAKADILKALAASYDYGTAVLNEMTDAALVETVTGPRFLGTATRAKVVYQAMAHTMDIYGQMAVYLRLNGIVPPASRGV